MHCGEPCCGSFFPFLPKFHVSLYVEFHRTTHIHESKDTKEVNDDLPSFYQKLDFEFTRKNIFHFGKHGKICLVNEKLDNMLCCWECSNEILHVRFGSERLRVRSPDDRRLVTPSVHVRRQSLPVWPPTLNKIPLQNHINIGS